MLSFVGLENVMAKKLDREALKLLVDAIDRKWSLETERRRTAALSPAIEEALEAARQLLGLEPVSDVDEYRKRFR